MIESVYLGSWGDYGVKRLDDLRRVSSAIKYFAMTHAAGRCRLMYVSCHAVGGRRSLPHAIYRHDMQRWLNPDALVFATLRNRPVMGKG